MSEDKGKKDEGGNEEEAEETPVEETAEGKLETLKTEVAELTVSEITERHAKNLNRLKLIKSQEKISHQDLQELSFLSKAISFLAETAKDLVAIEEMETPEELDLEELRKSLKAESEGGDDNGESEGTEEAPAEEDSETETGETAETTETEEQPAEASETEKDLAPVPAAAKQVKIKTAAASTEPLMRDSDGKSITSLSDFRTALQNKFTGQGTRTLGTFSVTGTRGDRTAGVLGSDPLKNFYTMYGTTEDEQTLTYKAAFGGASVPEGMNHSYTAALNCKGPVEVAGDVPFCYSNGRPLEDSGLIASFESDVQNGQLQFYDCHALPEIPELVEAPCCEEGDCGSCPGPGDCSTYECITPGEIYEPKPYSICMCVPESLRFANKMVLDVALSDFATQQDVMFELMWLEQIRAASIIRSVDGAALPEHGAFNTIVRTFLTLKSRLALDTRCSDGLNDYTVFVPGGEAGFCAAMADKLSRVVGCECPGEDILAMLQQRFGLNVVFGLDQDPNGAQIAAGYTAPWQDSPAPALGAPLPLEDMVDAATIYLIPRNKFGTASPLTIEYGLEDRDRCSIHSGCQTLYRKQWMFDLLNIGCRDSIGIDFTNLGTCGTGPDLTPCS